ncbi:MAG: 50S ribosomal protein L15 [Patescibacteria group bacterium]|nr:50S ribosomal protein L15 [Patescibacteria group bacterium]
MELSNLKKLTKNKTRKGRGISAGKGKTAGRGTKGQKSRTGGNIKPGFEGGQMPLKQRIPKKRGFKSRNEKPVTVTLGRLNRFKDGSVVTEKKLKEEGIISRDSAKIVDGGELTKKLTIALPISKGAAEKVKKAGGKIER